MKSETITLSDAEMAFIRSRIAEGENQTTSEVISESLELLAKKIRRDKKRMERFLAAVELGEKDFREGHFTTINNERERRAFWDEIMEDVRKSA